MRAKKSFGQHFLRNQSVIKKIVEAAEITPGEVVLEVGPGHGVLTEALVEVGANVIAVEADRDLIAELEEKFGSSAQIIFSDVLKLDLATLPRTYKVVANLPYNIAAAVIEKFLSAEYRPERLVVMVQKEVADRMQAKAGEMSVLSVACQMYTHMKRVVNVPPGSFSPPPKVDSAVVRMDVTTPNPSSERRGEDRDPEAVIALAKAGFRSRRKLLKSNLLATGASKDQIKQAFLDAGVDELARAQELSVDQWTALWYNLSDL